MLDPISIIFTAMIVVIVVSFFGSLVQGIGMQARAR